MQYTRMQYKKKQGEYKHLEISMANILYNILKNSEGSQIIFRGRAI